MFRFAIYLSVWLLGLMLSIAYYQYFYPLIFHSDSGSIQVLAQAMIDESSFIPKDFNFGNQIILFRANPFIALALSYGFVGYKAYTIGSALSFSLYFLVSFCVFAYYQNDFIKGLLLNLLFYVPLGVLEQDFILGQQAHLSNVLLALLFASNAYLICTQFSKVKTRKILFASSFICVFIMGLEAPARATLVIFPVLLACLAIINSAKSFVILFVGSSSALALATLINKLIFFHQYTVQGLPDIKISSLNIFFERMIWMFGRFYDAYAGMHLHSLPGLNFLTFAVLALDIVCVIAFIAVTVAIIKLGLQASWRRFCSNSMALLELSPFQFFAYSGLLGCFSGFFITGINLAIELDIRHFFWGLQFIKLFICSILLNAIYIYFSGKIRFIVFLFIFYVAILPLWDSSVLVAIKNDRLSITRIEPPFIDIRYFSTLYAVDKVYGNFWNVHRLNVTIPIKSSVVAVNNDGVILHSNWLTRKSMECVKNEKVFYYLDDAISSDKILASKIHNSGGVLLASRNNLSLYIGDPLWDMSGCRY